MDTQPTNLLGALRTLEAEGTLDLNRVTSLLGHVDDDSTGLTDSEKLMISAERMAFRFAADSDFAEANWKTYYGPFSIINIGDSKVSISPSIDRVTPEMLEYWKERADETPHPVLRARYADLVWDFSKKVTDKPADVALAKMAIDAGLEAVIGNRCRNFITVWPLLKRSLQLALSLHDDERTKRTVAIAIDYDDAQSKPGERNAWGHSFDILFNTKGVPLTDDQRDRIVAGLEKSLSTSTSPDGNGTIRDPFAAKDAAQRLVTYYRKQNKREEVKRVVALLGKGVIDAAKDVNELMASAWLKDAFDFAASSQDKDTADRLAVAMRAKSLNIKDKGQTFKWEQSVDPALVEEFLLELLEGEEDEALHRILGYYIPDWNQTQEQVLDFAKKFVFTAFIAHTIVDPSGREVATVGSVQDDLPGRTIRQISQNMTYVVDFLYMALKRWIDKFAVTPERLCERLLTCPVFTPDSKAALIRGIHAYYEGDHITAVHVLIPQIENAFRAFLIGGGVSIYRQNRYGGIDFRTLGDMIADDIVKNVLGENVQHYLQVLLVDPRGWNLRNTVCHGLVDALIYVQPHSDRIVHVLLILSQLKLKPTQESKGTPNEHDKPSAP